MTESQKNIGVALRLAHHLGEPVEEIRVGVMCDSLDGSSLYEITLGNGEHRYVVEGETGELMEPTEDGEEAYNNYIKE